MADRWWKGTSSDWSDANNWAATEGGAGGVGVPTSSDHAKFSNAAGTGNCTLTADAACSALSFMAAATGGTNNYTGTIDFASFNISVAGSISAEVSGLTVTLGSGTITVGAHANFRSATLNRGSSTLVLNGNTSNLLGACTYNNITINGTACIFASTGMSFVGTLLVNSNKKVTINTGASMYALSGATTTNNGTIASAGTGLFVINDTAAAKLNTGGTLSAAVRFDCTSGTCDVPARTYGGAVTFYSSSASERTCVLGAGTHIYSSTLSLNANSTGNLVVDAATNDPTVNVTGLLDKVGTGGGEERISWGDGVWTCAANVDVTGGTDTKGAGTLVMTGNNAVLTSSGQALNNLTIENNWSCADALDIDGTLKCIMGGKTLTFASGVTHAVNDFNLEGALGSLITLAPGTAITDWGLTLAQAAAPTKISYVSVDYSDATTSPAAVKANDGTNTDGGHNHNWTFTAGSTTRFLFHSPVGPL